MTRRAVLIAVGTELLRLGRAETNTAWLAQRMIESGIEVAQRSMIADNPGDICSAVRAALATADCVVLTGGLGPTDDDRTRQALAQALERPLLRDTERLELLRRRFEEYGFPWSESQARQADLPEGGHWIDNSRGSAAGFLVRAPQGTVVALPGVPSEMKPMVEAGLADWFGRPAGRAVAATTLKAAGRGEGEIDARLADLYGSEGVDVITLASAQGVELHVRATGMSDAEASERLRRVRDAMVRRLGSDLVTEDERSLAAVVGELLLARNEKLATAESCTGGLVGAEVTAVAGSSSWYLGGWVVYDNTLKRGWAGVESEVLERHGAVSEAVARRIAEAVRERSGAHWAIGITGIAGPDGGTADKPVGLVHVSVAAKDHTWHWRTHQPGDRDWVRRRSVAFALDRLRRALLEAGT